MSKKTTYFNFPPNRVGIRNSTDYSPFGVELDGRTVSVDGYRYGYQGSEKDNEFKGEGNSYTTEFRQLDPRLGRWLCIDLLTHKYPYYSPYQYVHNSPISVIDLFGLGDPLEVMKIRRNRASNLQGAKARNSGTRAHQGFDLYAAPGTSAKAVKNAVVYDVSYSSSYGNTVTLEITDEKGTKSYAFYAHLSVVSVSKNQKVDEGDEIGLTGQTGNAKGQPAEDAHLHFELRSSPSPGLGMTGRLNPNEVLDTKFYSQDPEAINQATVGVLKEQKDGSVIKINLDGTEKIIKNKTNFQNLGQIRFDSSLAKEAKDVNGHKYLIVHDIKSQKDFGVVRKPDGSYDFYKKTQK
ncbi:MAG: hypothetical protein RL762_1114 [Bacteroidota bacterium]